MNIIIVNFSYRSCDQDDYTSEFFFQEDHFEQAKAKFLEIIENAKQDFFDEGQEFDGIVPVGLEEGMEFSYTEPEGGYGHYYCVNNANLDCPGFYVDMFLQEVA